MKTKMVRAAVAITPDGKWTINGWSTDGGRAVADEDMESAALDCLDTDRAATHFITAEVPIPESSEITATVEEPSDV